MLFIDELAVYCIVICYDYLILYHIFKVVGIDCDILNIDDIPVWISIDWLCLIITICFYCLML